MAPVILALLHERSIPVCRRPLSPPQSAILPHSRSRPPGQFRQQHCAAARNRVLLPPGVDAPERGPPNQESKLTLPRGDPSAGLSGRGQVPPARVARRTSIRCGVRAATGLGAGKRQRPLPLSRAPGHPVSPPVASPWFAGTGQAGSRARCGAAIAHPGYQEAPWPSVHAVYPGTLRQPLSVPSLPLLCSRMSDEATPRGTAPARSLARRGSP